MRRPVEPAITRVSKSLRDESLPIYYQTLLLALQTFVKSNHHGFVWFATNRWYHKLAASKVNWVRHLEIRFDFLEHYFGEPVKLLFTVRLNKRENNFVIHHSFGAGWFSDAHRKGDPADCEEVVQVLKKHLQSSLAASAIDVGIGALTANDIDNLVEVDPNILP